MIKVWWALNNGRANFGDMMSPWLVRNIAKQEVAFPRMSGLFKEEHYFTIGSILCNSNKKSIVWGSGLVDENGPIMANKFHAVRGPLTRKVLTNLNKNVPEVYGDPAILAPNYYKSLDADIKYETAIIPHIVDFEFIRDQERANKTGRLVINLLDSIETVIDQMNSANRILSSSLHGVIVAHAYRIPVLWVKFSDKIIGSSHNYKFHDYFEGIQSDYYDAIEFRNGVPSEAEVSKLFDKYSQNIYASDKLENVAAKLLDACPFK